MGREPHSEHLPGIQIDGQGKIIRPTEPRPALERWALNLSDATHLPLEIDHVQQAILLAVQAEAISAGACPSTSDADLIAVLAPYAKTAFFTARDNR
jgi:hypothetical protein